MGFDARAHRTKGRRRSVERFDLTASGVVLVGSVGAREVAEHAFHIDLRMPCDAEQCRVIGGKPQPVHARIDFEVDGPRGFGLPEFTDQRFELFFGVNSGLQSVLKQCRKGVGCGA